MPLLVFSKTAFMILKFNDQLDPALSIALTLTKACSKLIPAHFQVPTEELDARIKRDFPEPADGDPCLSN